MLTIRRITKKDEPSVLGLIKELDLAYPTQKLDNFWVVEENREIIGLADLKEFDDFWLLSSVGVDKKHQHRGVASLLLKELIKDLKKDVYLYTITPEFFSRLGFQIVPRPSDLPAREIFNCAECRPQHCVCMVKRP